MENCKTGRLSLDDIKTAVHAHDLVRVGASQRKIAELLCISRSKVYDIFAGRGKWAGTVGCDTHIGAIVTVRKETGLGLKDARNTVDSWGEQGLEPEQDIDVDPVVAKERNAVAVRIVECMEQNRADGSTLTGDEAWEGAAFEVILEEVHAALDHIDTAVHAVYFGGKVSTDFEDGSLMDLLMRAISERIRVDKLLND